MTPTQRLMNAWDQLERLGAVVERVPLDRIGRLAEPLARIEEGRVRALADASARPPSRWPPSSDLDAEARLRDDVEELVRLVADALHARTTARPLRLVA